MDKGDGSAAPFLRWLGVGQTDLMRGAAILHSSDATTLLVAASLLVGGPMVVASPVGANDLSFRAEASR
jgi:hypothetical protein